MEYIVANIDEAPSRSAADARLTPAARPRAAGRGPPAAPPHRAGAPAASRPPARGASRTAAGAARHGRHRRRSGSAPPGRRAWQPARRRSRRAEQRACSTELASGSTARTRARSSGGVSGGPLGLILLALADRGQQPVQLRPALELQAADAAAPSVGSLRPPAGQLDQRRVAHQPGDRRVAPPRLALAPRGDGRPARRAARRAACRGPGTRRHAWSGSCTTAASRAEPPLHLLGRPGQPAQPARAALGQRVGGGEQVADVVGGVLDLRSASAGASTSR